MFSEFRACPPDAAVAILLIQLLLAGMLDRLAVILHAQVVQAQVRLPRSADRAGFGHRFVPMKTVDEGGPNFEEAQKVRGVPGVAVGVSKTLRSADCNCPCGEGNRLKDDRTGGPLCEEKRDRRFTLGIPCTWDGLGDQPPSDGITPTTREQAPIPSFMSGVSFNNAIPDEGSYTILTSSNLSEASPVSFRLTEERLRSVETQTTRLHEISG
jgi:hypothetical protein